VVVVVESKSGPIIVPPKGKKLSLLSPPPGALPLTPPPPSSRYELEWAQSQYRQGRLGLALKKFTAIEKHFQEFIEDQFDFHTYCIRKMTLRAYVDILR